MQKVDEILEIKKNQIESLTVNSSTVNSKERSLSTVNSKDDDEQSKTVEEDIAEVIKKHNLPKEGKARLLAELLNDIKSLRYYEILVQEHNPEFLIERAYYVKEMDQQNKLRRHNRAVYFLGILRKLKMRTQFKKTA